MPLVEWLWLLLTELEKLATQHQEQRIAAFRRQLRASQAQKGVNSLSSTDARRISKQKAWQAERQQEYLNTSIQLDLVAHEVGKC